MNMHIFNATGQGHVNQMAEVQIIACCACHKGQWGPAKQWSGGGSCTCSLIEMHYTTWCVSQRYFAIRTMLEKGCTLYVASTPALPPGVKSLPWSHKLVSTTLLHLLSLGASGR